MPQHIFPAQWTCLRCKAGQAFINYRRTKCLRCGAGREWLEKIPASKACPDCGQPMKPKGVKKRPDEWDHAQGCRYDKTKMRRRE